MNHFKPKMFRNDDKLMEEASKYKYQCKCGHVVVIYPFEGKNKKLCRWCNRYVFTSSKDEFLYRISERVKRSQDNEKES